MLSAQVNGRRGAPMGMNVPGTDNRQFALNIMHWLSGVKFPARRRDDRRETEAEAAPQKSAPWLLLHAPASEPADAAELAGHAGRRPRRQSPRRSWPPALLGRDRRGVGTVDRHDHRRRLGRDRVPRPPRHDRDECARDRRRIHRRTCGCASPPPRRRSKVRCPPSYSTKTRAATSRSSG